MACGSARVTGFGFPPGGQTVQPEELAQAQSQYLTCAVLEGRQLRVGRASTNVRVRDFDVQHQSMTEADG